MDKKAFDILFANENENVTDDSYEDDKPLTDYERYMAESEKLLSRSRHMREKAKKAREKLATKIGMYFLRRFPSTQTFDDAKKMIDDLYNRR